MTIIAIVERPSFAVIAADRLWHAVTHDGTYTSGQHCKIVIHPRLPLAIGLAGIAALPPVEQPVPVRDVVQSFIDKVTPAKLSFDYLFPLLVAGLHQRVRATMGFASPRMPPPILDLWTAIVHESRAETRLLRLHQSVENARDFRATLRYPDALAGFYSTGRYSEGTAARSPVFCDGGKSAAEVAALLRKCVEEGIEAEAAQNNGVNRECGGGVDVAIVNPQRAFFWEPK